MAGRQRLFNLRLNQLLQVVLAQPMIIRRRDSARPYAFERNVASSLHEQVERCVGFLELLVFDAKILKADVGNLKSVDFFSARIFIS